MITVQRFTQKETGKWNSFVSGSINGTFLFDRGFMDYHSDRFEDHSLLFFQDNNLVGALPANFKGGVLQSHGGLTYGGVIVAPRTSASTVMDIFSALTDYAKLNAIEEIHYKPVPTMYHSIPTEHDRYALFRNNAKLMRSDLSTAVWLSDPQKISTSRRQGARKAAKAGVKVIQSSDWVGFWSLLSHVLAEHHQTAPTHTLSEMEQLSKRFPEQINLFIAQTEDGNIQAGAVVFDCGPTVHSQYLAASDAGRESGALNAVIITLLEDVYVDRRWFDFGISSDEAGRVVNSGLLRQKEMFGGTTLTYDQYLLTI